MLSSEVLYLLPALAAGSVGFLLGSFFVHHSLRPALSLDVVTAVKLADVRISRLLGT